MFHAQPVVTGMDIDSIKPRLVVKAPEQIGILSMIAENTPRYFDAFFF